jgi:hypothetical protein
VRSPIKAKFHPVSLPSVLTFCFFLFIFYTILSALATGFLQKHFSLPFSCFPVVQYPQKDGQRVFSSLSEEEEMENIHEQLLLQDCPYCGGPGLLEEEHGWCWYAVCLDCGAQTAAFEFKKPENREAAARTAADMWNLGKIMRSGAGGD